MLWTDLLHRWIILKLSEPVYCDIGTHVIDTSNKKHFNEINSYVGMTILRKEQGQDDYFSQQSILLTYQPA